MNFNTNTLVDKDTTPEETINILRTLLSEGFDYEIDLLAQSLGRPPEEIENILNGDEIMDEDLLMKSRGLAQERNLEIS